MVSQQEEIFRISKKRIYLLWFLLFVLLAVLIGLPTWLAIRRLPYPDLDLLLFCYAMVPMMWIAVLADFGPRATQIEFHEEGFRVEKIAQKASWHSYTDILTYNERPNSSKFESLNELGVYLSNNWFLIRSNDFKDYDYLKDRFTQYGQLSIRTNVLTTAERKRFRWAIIGFALMIIANIVFGYLAHNAVDKNPARLTAVTNIVTNVSKNMTKGKLTGFTLRLSNWPDFEFTISRKSYDVDIHSLQQAVIVN